MESIGGIQVIQHMISNELKKRILITIILLSNSAFKGFDLKCASELPIL